MSEPVFIHIVGCGHAVRGSFPLKKAMKVARFMIKSIESSIQHEKAATPSGQVPSETSKDEHKAEGSNAR